MLLLLGKVDKSLQREEVEKGRILVDVNKEWSHRINVGLRNGLKFNYDSTVGEICLV